MVCDRGLMYPMLSLLLLMQVWEVMLKKPGHGIALHFVDSSHCSIHYNIYLDWRELMFKVVDGVTIKRTVRSWIVQAL